MKDKSIQVNTPVKFLKPYKMGINEFKTGDIAEITLFYKALLKRKKVVRDATESEIKNNNN